ncbi:MAG TPA: hypothetical protein VIC62_14045 [Nakamurella sp.]|jgi:hypothetical protein
MKPSGSSIPVARIQPLVEIGLDVGPLPADATGPADVDGMADGVPDGATELGALPAGDADGVVLPQAATRATTARNAPSRGTLDRRPVGAIAVLRT